GTPRPPPAGAPPVRRRPPQRPAARRRPARGTRGGTRRAPPPPSTGAQAGVASESTASRPSRSRRSAVASTDSSCARLLKAPFASTVPSRETATPYGLPGTASSDHRSASRCSSSNRTDRNGSRSRNDSAGSSERQSEQVSDVKTASESDA